MSQVVVVGAGPTGLLLAGDLAEAGVAVTVLEKRNGEVSNLSRAFAVHARTMEQLDARGLVEEVDRTGVGRVTDIRLFERVHVDLGKLPSRFPYMLVSPQYNVERALLARAVGAGARIVYDAAVTAVRQDDTGAEVDTTGGTYRADYVVGTDGFHSAVRHALGQPFPGKSVLKSIMLADVRLRETPPDTLTVNGSGSEFTFIAPFGDGWWRVFAWDRRGDVTDDTPLELDEVRAITKRALGTDFGMYEARWLSRFHSDERQAPHYRVGRVFLAGDAAHVHSPAGGMGMNTGLQDAANLSWKLAAVLRGAPDALLDTYHAERHPVGEEVLRVSGTMIRLAMARSRFARALRGLVGGTALRVPAIHRRLTGRLTALGFRYRHAAGEHRLTGTRMPDVPLADGTRLYEALRGGRFVLVGTGDVTGWDDRVRVAAPAERGADTVLVRPDGYVAEVFTGTPDPAALRDTLTALAGTSVAE
ncbi:2-polyprenyl-6-methoxyphenol hydroxylase-like FAD-dependent oxidoreductase [Saccharothrix carnea]|uniref:2-polyprenyl-6-methoxyphenol hydroxylase-like FAD-dependent oxidoreductase n=1 Tax=Saccharothrix carnea TaxID=1280637 RepID=A0A2P8I2P0_SACCR|nr:FAD-dependent monooxygenase [Saccharothrix carnea]PSL52723.1 2-polyprenyl-6-methoxyphenol hydroxylase-like FAD-dependent oxidoreductase [Saccharothrix carnea]